MSFRNSDHFTDRFFRKKLKDVDLGNQDHLWKGIESALNEDKSSRRVLSFPWMLKSVLVLSLISFSLLASYRYFNNNSSNLNEDAKNGNRVTSGIVADNSFHSIQNNQSVENSDSRISNVNEVVSDNKTYHKAIDNSENPNNVTHNNETSKQKDGSSIINDFSEPISNDGLVNVGFQARNELENRTEDGKKNLNNLEGRDIEFNIIPGNDKYLIEYNSINWWPKQKKFKDDGCFTRDKSLERRRLYLDVYYSPEISRRTIEAKNVQSVAYANKRQMDETFIKAFSAGSRISMVSANGFSVRTGFNYSEIKERFNFVKGTQLITLIKKDAQGNPIDTVQEEVAIVDNIYNRYKFFDIPISVGYEIDLVDFVFTVSGGLGINLMTKREGFVYGPDLTSKLNLSSSVEGNQKIFKDNAGISLLASFGLNYKIRKGFMLLAEPSMRYYLGSLTDSKYPISQKYMQFGLIAGLRYQLVY